MSTITVRPAALPRGRFLTAVPHGVLTLGVSRAAVGWPLRMDAARFRDRVEAGRLLAEHLRAYEGRDDVIVLALPRGGVPVAYEVAKALGLPLGVFVVRKLGVPGHEELAMGAIASGGVLLLDEGLVRALGAAAARRRGLMSVDTEATVAVPAGDATLDGDLVLPEQACAPADHRYRLAAP